MFIDDSKRSTDIEQALAELTHVAADYVQEPVFLYGRPHGFAGPTLHKVSSVWLIWMPLAKRPAEKVVTLIKGSFKATRDGSSHDHLIEISRAHVMVLDLEDFVLSDDYVERVNQRVAEQRGF